MSQDKTRSKKRKSVAADVSSSGVSGSSSGVHVTVAEASTSGPVFVNYPAVRPSKTVKYTVYSRDPSGTSSLAKTPSQLAGETGDVEYFSTNRDRAQRPEGEDCQYLPALYDPSTNTLTIAPSAPLYLLTHRVKRTAQQNPVDDGLASARDHWRTQRNNLGEAFGTRKAKSQIKAQEREQVDVRAMQGVKGHLMSSIGLREEDAGPVAPSALIPIPNLATDQPFEVYPRTSLISDAEWSSIDVQPLVSAADDKARAAVLPYRRSRFVEDRIRSTVRSSAGGKKNTLRMLYYLAALLALHDLHIDAFTASELQAKIPQLPRQLVDGLITRFAEQSGKKFKVTAVRKVKLLAWICTCYLAADGWSTDVGRVAGELKTSPTKVAEVFKSLGCKVDLPSTAERERLGLSLDDAKKQRRAVLRAPVQYPKPKLRGPAKR
ncbi:DNA-directed RNA polymerase I subunit rpa49 [Cryptotrichosporon argae]